MNAANVLILLETLDAAAKTTQRVNEILQKMKSEGRADISDEELKAFQDENIAHEQATLARIAELRAAMQAK